MMTFIFLVLGAVITCLGVLMLMYSKTGAQDTVGGALVLLGAVWLLIVMALATPAHAHDAMNPELDGWYSSLMQPDHPTSPCCGEADAYWADEVHVRDGKTFAIITDDRPDEPLKRPHIPVGTEIEVPDYKLKWDKGNPTGHGVLFISYTHHVFCYVQPGGA